MDQGWLREHELFQAVEFPRLRAVMNVHLGPLGDKLNAAEVGVKSFDSSIMSVHHASVARDSNCDALFVQIELF
jgi:hypothetical protein